MTIFELAQMIEKNLEVTWVHDYYKNKHLSESRRKECWQTSFKGVEVLEGECLGSAWGGGITPEAAITDYVEQIRGKTLVLNAMRDNRKEINVPPTLTYKD